MFLSKEKLNKDKKKSFFPLKLTQVLLRPHLFDKKYMKWALFSFILWSTLARPMINDSEKFVFAEKHDRLKYHLLIGEDKKAFAILKSSTALFQKANLFHYYQAIFSYLKSDYTETLDHIKNIHGLSERRNKQICQIEVVSRMMTRQWKQAYNRWRICAGNYSNNNSAGQYFIKTLLESKALGYSPFEARQFREVQSNPKKLELWMKLTAYLGRTDIVKDVTDSIPDKLLMSKEIKELQTYVLYDLKEIQLAFDIIEEEESLTKDLLKTNVMIYHKKYEEAYEKLQASFKQNSLSKAILSRLILLSFGLKKSEDSLKYITLYQKIFKEVPLDLLWKKTLILTSLYRLKEAKIALNEYMNRVKGIGRGSIITIRKYMALQNNNELESLFFSEKSCEKGDLSGCWLKILLRNDLDQFKEQALPSNYYQQSIAKLNAGWLYPVNEQAPEYPFAKFVSQPKIQKLDQVERTKELFFQD